MLHILAGALVLDEISISPDLTFSAQDLQFKGFANYIGRNEVGLEDCALEGSSTSLCEANDIPALADHALVLMFKPFLRSWVQPIGVFAAKNAVSGEKLHQITKEAVCVLENLGAKVTCIINDGASTNKTMWKL